MMVYPAYRSVREIVLTNDGQARSLAFSFYVMVHQGHRICFIYGPGLCSLCGASLHWAHSRFHECSCLVRGLASSNDCSMVGVVLLSDRLR